MNQLIWNFIANIAFIIFAVIIGKDIFIAAAIVIFFVLSCAIVIYEKIEGLNNV